MTKSDLLVYALIFVVEAVVFASLGVAAKKVLHLVLIKTERAGVLVGILVVNVEFTALTIRGLSRSVFREVECHIILKQQR